MWAIKFDECHFPMVIDVEFVRGHWFENEEAVVYRVEEMEDIRVVRRFFSAAEYGVPKMYLFETEIDAFKTVSAICRQNMSKWAKEMGAAEGHRLELVKLANLAAKEEE